jgi:hypothetical protein
MNSKAVAVNAISLVAIITIITILSLIGLYSYIQGQTLSTNQATCFIKKANYCLDWAKTNYDPSQPPYDWDTKSPYQCDKVGVSKPQAKEACTGAPGQ